MITRTDRNQTFDADGNLISEEVVQVDITREVTEWAVADKIRAAIDGNVTALGQLDTAVTNLDAIIAGTPTTVAQCNTAIDNLANVVKNLTEQSGRMMRQITAIERLLIGDDLLETDAGT
jgi:hypothetical protein